MQALLRRDARDILADGAANPYPVARYETKRHTIKRARHTFNRN